MEDKIQNIDAGYRAVVKLILSKGIKILECEPINQGRYYLVKTEEGSNYLVCFKREFFLSFGKIFQREGESGVGESINVEDLKIAIGRYNVNKLMFVYSSGGIYSISVCNLLLYGHKRVNEFEGKETYSFSIQHLTRENITVTV